MDRKMSKALAQVRPNRHHPLSFHRFLFGLFESTCLLMSVPFLISNGGGCRFPGKIVQNAPCARTSAFVPQLALLPRPSRYGVGTSVAITPCMTNQNTVQCPKCQTKIEITKAMTAQVESRIREELESEVDAKKAALEKEAKKLVQQKAALEKAEIEVDQKVKEGVEAAVAAQRAAIVAQARKKAEAYLEYLGKHDVLTQLRNRAFYTEELNRLSRKGPWPLSMLAIDMNGLKVVNDEHGHTAGDAMLRRMGEVLSKAVDAPACAARIGGDEFVVLLPGTDERGAVALQERILSLLELNNQFYPGHSIQVSMGHACGQEGTPIESIVQGADKAMYAEKARLYRDKERDRRVSAA